MNSVLKRGTRFFAAIALVVGLFANGAIAGMERNGTEISSPVMGGYDPVSYFNAGKPMRGNGYNAVTHEGGTYLFATKENKKMFEANPEKYAPQFGGYCAYGVAVGKKFYSDPTIWKVVDGKLYLNLDKNIQKKWNADMNGHIRKAHSNWRNIEHKHPSQL
ncbi:MAG: YHS domain-containing protein [Nitrospinae bacterium]|nr:YHS domain-containing protein [Nitrospinota bacterium]